MKENNKSVSAKIAHTENNKQPGRAELLKMAKEKYPQGTIFRNISTGRTVVSCGEFNTNPNTASYTTVFDVDAGDHVYSDFGEERGPIWADIVKPVNPPKEQEETIEAYAILNFEAIDGNGAIVKAFF